MIALAHLRPRIVAAIAIGLLAGGWTVLYLQLNGDWIQAADFTYPWLGAQALMHRANPYAYVTAHGPPFGHSFLYPLPAAIATLPLAWLPMRAAAGIGVGLACGFLAFAVTRQAFWPLLLFLSAPALQVTKSVQVWAPTFTAAAFYAPMLGLLAAKPNLGLPLVAFQARLRSIVVGGVVGLVILAISFAVDPSWLGHWLASVRGAPEAVHIRPPLLQPLGFFIALAALKWRRPEARLLLCMGLVPQTWYFYDQLPLLLVPGSKREMLAFAVVSQLAALSAPIADLGDRMPFVILGLYAPAIVMVLRRPNVPEWANSH